MRTKLVIMLAGAFLAVAGSAFAGVIISMNLVDAGGIGQAVGTVTAEQTAYGVVFTPRLHGLEPGKHGLHVHRNPSCEPKEKDGRMVPALAAGGHYDPAGTGHHGPPWGDGHLGDLPVLTVDSNGRAGTPVLAPRLRLEDLQGRSLMIHAGGDNYSDQPEKLGGGGARMACGVVK
ncbi:Cu-Zn family superoxide dismutase [Geothermobacter ehrlichii]|uniref:Superoxide dismutase [Cu-Zn] n=1 Tax=Geothermobacter ehrlichii TaxID=213224 RepID=A0A5D3WKG5_9BACT|nr:superoxide dismutase family protein [Geothermobacter ehrlichii]TYO98882.1 Cu-Zn family superoxide dismutase [Geothermobacter ehrlichii]